ncbi:hypothetical protein POTOM_032626 [Populus tomentosa]|uniref:Chromatin target of PRMT1 protein C-terminal domain-containing protein n=1 Tax=Populus tomentosa TaxID=118781 RepID=A0A8X8CQH4_POPTO|nr:hypothetical protein POTOM_032626 [Populus tomentosa]
MTGAADRRYLTHAWHTLRTSDGFFVSYCSSEYLFFLGNGRRVFIRPAEAVAAVKRYNRVQLDGKPMKIEIVGANFAPPHANAAFGNSNGLSGRFVVHYSYDLGCRLLAKYVENLCFDSVIDAFSAFEVLDLVVPAVLCQNIIMTSICYNVRSRGGALVQLRGGSGGGRGIGRGRGRGRGCGEKVSAEDLDEYLEKYHSESMPIN